MGRSRPQLEREQGANVWLTFAMREGKNREVKNVLGHLGLAGQPADPGVVRPVPARRSARRRDRGGDARASARAARRARGGARRRRISLAPVVERGRRRRLLRSMRTPVRANDERTGARRGPRRASALGLADHPLRAGHLGMALKGAEGPRRSAARPSAWASRSWRGAKARGAVCAARAR